MMWRLTFYCLDDGVISEMTVDSSYRNFRQQGWDHVTESANPWGVYSGLAQTDRLTRQGVPVVTADGTAELIYRCEDRNQALQLVKACEHENNRNSF
jgi:hypothetical protein